MTVASANPTFPTGPQTWTQVRCEALIRRHKQFQCLDEFVQTLPDTGESIQLDCGQAVVEVAVTHGSLPAEDESAKKTNAQLPGQLPGAAEDRLLMRAARSENVPVVPGAELPGGVMRLTFRVLEGSLPAASCGLRLSIEPWSTDVYTLMPAAVYDSNRLPPEGTWRSEELESRGPDCEPIQTINVPAMRVGGGGCIEQLAGDMSVPLIGWVDPACGQGRILATTQRADGATHDSAIRLVEADDAASATVELLASGVRLGEKRPGRPCHDSGQNLQAGDVVTLTVLHQSFEADGPSALHRQVMAMRPHLSLPRVASQTPLVAREMIPFSEVWNIQQRKYNEQNWVASDGYYSVGMREAPSQDWQTGWVGGCNALYPLLAEGDRLTRQRARKTFDFLQTGVTPSGFIRDRFHHGRWTVSDRIFLRYQADALYFLCKSLLLIRSRGEVIDESCASLPRGIADAFCKLWQRYGQLGQYVDANTGEIQIGGSCAAGLAPAGLLLMDEWLAESTYRQTAEQIGRYYATQFTHRAFTNGGPGDISQAHDSESAFALLASYTHLLEATGQREWLDIANDAACQAATYVMPYDFDFPADSTFGRLGMRTRGTVFANVQNKHSAPGICSLSGVALLRLARAGGDRRWLDLLADIAGAIPLYMSRDDRPIVDRRPNQHWPVMPEGWINERINTSDWEVRGDPATEIGVGEIFGGSTWSEVAMLLTRTELPGVYVRRDLGWCVALDHVRAALTDDSIHLENPTPYNASVKLMVEDANAAAQPLGAMPNIGQRQVTIPPHGRVVVTLGG